PFALYRAISTFQESRAAAEPGDRADLGWAAAYALLVLGSLAMLLATIKFGAVVRTADLRYWWVYPAALVVVCGLYTVPTLRPAPTRMFLRLQGLGMLVIAGFLLITIFFTQSRGPWLGMAAGLFVFFTLLLWNAYRRARQAGDRRAARWRGLLIGEIVLALAL